MAADHSQAAPRALQIRVSGTGGQGLILGGRMLAEACMRQGWFVAQSQSYEPTSRGGVSRSDLVVGPREPDYPLVTRLDVLVVMDQSAVKISTGLVDADSIVLVDSDLVPEPPAGGFAVTALSLTAQARALRNVRVANVVSLGALVALADVCEFDQLEQAVESLTPPKFKALNLDAVRAGRDLVRAHAQAVALPQ